MQLSHIHPSIISWWWCCCQKNLKRCWRFLLCDSIICFLSKRSNWMKSFSSSMLPQVYMSLFEFKTIRKICLIRWNSLELDDGKWLVSMIRTVGISFDGQSWSWINTGWFRSWWINVDSVSKKNVVEFDILTRSRVRLVSSSIFVEDFLRYRFFPK